MTVHEVRMPQLGETVTEGEVTAWHKQPGERVDEQEPLLEVATDKVDTDIPSTVAGVLREVHVGVGEVVAVGTLLAEIELDGAG